MNDIAITGIAFKLPQGATDERSFWDVLKTGKNLMTEWPVKRASVRGFAKGRSGAPNTVYPDICTHNMPISDRLSCLGLVLTL